MSTRATFSDLSPVDREALDALIQTYFSFAVDANWTDWVASCSAEIMILPPGSPPISGRLAVKQWLETLPPISSISGDTHQLHGNGRFAYAVGNALVTTQSDDGEKYAITRWLAVYEKGRSDKWVMRADIWNDETISDQQIEP